MWTEIKYCICIGGWGSESNREIKEFLCWGRMRETLLFQSLGLAAPTCAPSAHLFLSFIGVLRKHVKYDIICRGFNEHAVNITLYARVLSKCVEALPLPQSSLSPAGRSYRFQKKRNAAKQNGTTCTKKTRFRSAAHFGNKITREWSREAPAATAQAQQQQQRAAKHCRAQQSTAAAQHSTAQQSRPEQRSKSQHRGTQ